QPRMQVAIGGKHLPLGDARLATPEIGDEAAGLPHQNDARGDVPELKVLLPETVITAGRDPGEIERGRAEAANSGHFRRDGAEDLLEAIQIAMPLERRAGRNQRFVEMAARGYA